MCTTKHISLCLKWTSFFKYAVACKWWQLLKQIFEETYERYQQYFYWDSQFYFQIAAVAEAVRNKLSVEAKNEITWHWWEDRILNILLQLRIRHEKHNCSGEWDLLRIFILFHSYQYCVISLLASIEHLLLAVPSFAVIWN